MSNITTDAERRRAREIGRRLAEQYAEEQGWVELMVPDAWRWRMCRTLESDPGVALTIDSAGFAPAGEFARWSALENEVGQGWRGRARELLAEGHERPA